MVNISQQAAKTASKILLSLVNQVEFFLLVAYFWSENCK